MSRKKGVGYGAKRVAAKHLSSDQQRYNRVARKKGQPGSRPWKQYVFGGMRNHKRGKH